MAGRTYKRVDLSGQRFGRLVVLHQAPIDGKRTKWVCRCDCGRQIVRRDDLLWHPKMVSCGCYRAENKLIVDGGKALLPSWAIDMTGKVFGLLTVVRPVEADKRGVLWLCRCECGTEKVLPARQLNRGAVNSCGCLRRALSIQRSTRHGGSRTSEYQIWRGMVDRCENPGSAVYDRYGGRGIRVCDRWKSSFEAFRADMGSRPSNKHTLDRVNNDEGYGPDNCRWASYLVQANNTRQNVWVEYMGESKTVAQWIRHLCLPLSHSTYLSRIKNGWSARDAFTQPSRKKPKGA